jgi:hypothetical protein
VFLSLLTSVTARKLDKCLHFLSILIVRKLDIGLIIRHASLNVIQEIISTYKYKIFAESYPGYFLAL